MYFYTEEYGKKHNLTYILLLRKVTCYCIAERLNLQKNDFKKYFETS